MCTTLMCFILAVVAIHLVCAKPQLVFETNYTSDSTTMNIYSSLRGVNEGSSPFVMVNNANFQSYSASGKRLAQVDVSVDGVFVDTPPLMNQDASNNTLFVVGLPSGVVVAYAAETLKQKWKFTANNCLTESCIVFALVYVEPELARCPSGAGGVSILTAGFNTTLSVVDMDTGASCGKPINFPPSHHFEDYAKMKVQGYPSGGALKRPMFVVVHTTNNLIFGIDGVSGEVKYIADLKVSSLFFKTLIPKSSPTNELFAYTLEDQNSNVYVAFRSIANGAVQLQVPFNQTSLAETTSSFGWIATAQSQGLGAVSRMGWDNPKEAWGSVMISALDGSMSFGHYTPDNYGPASVPMVNVDNEWTVSICTTATSSSQQQFLYAFPVAKNDVRFVAKLGSSPNLSNANQQAFAFTFEDGTVGFGGFLWQALAEGGKGVFTAYRV